ncbi:MAG TPA: YqeG family HAD IIIA-type phosphatase [Patescibacteria group bacterium]|nr:YqeG family HAD IIIA-type phosphatase [Patescibacteria group bacterium]
MTKDTTKDRMGRLLALLTPRQRLGDLRELDLAILQIQGIRGIIFDLDNTLIPWDSHCMPPEIIQWLQEVKKKGFAMAIVSNNRKKRVAAFAGPQQMHYVSRAYKPSGGGFLRAAASMGLEPAAIAVVGDQLLTDVLGGNRLRMYTVWVAPLPAKVLIGSRIIRRLECEIVKKICERGWM